jgi:unsaturated rhamnogalacturonyl hydrolase
MTLPSIKKTFVLLMVAIGWMNSQTNAQPVPEKKQVLKAMRTANAWFMKEWPDPGLPVVVKGVSRVSTLWTRGVYYEGLMELYKIDKQKSYYDYAVSWGEKHNWELRKGIQTRHADEHCAGQTYIDLYRIKRDPARIHDIKASIDLMVNSEKSDDWNWIDALQMAMPVFVRLGREYNDTSYYRKMYDLYSFTKYKHGGNGLYNPAEQLWWRDKDFVPPYKEPNGANCYWSRGNGWVVAALVRTLEMLPKNDPHYDEYMKDYKDLLAAVVKVQRPDGFWNVSLHDPEHFGGKELSGTALFVYGMAWGINQQLIDRKTYLPVVVKAWNAMVTDALHKDGFLGYVQGTGKEPKDGQPVNYEHAPDFTDYGLGCFLLAGSEVYRLQRK